MRASSGAKYQHDDGHEHDGEPPPAPQPGRHATERVVEPYEHAGRLDLHRLPGCIVWLRLERLVTLQPVSGQGEDAVAVETEVLGVLAEEEARVGRAVDVVEAVRLERAEILLPDPEVMLDVRKLETAGASGSAQRRADVRPADGRGWRAVQGRVDRFRVALELSAHVRSTPSRWHNRVALAYRSTPVAR